MLWWQDGKTLRSDSARVLWSNMEGGSTREVFTVCRTAEETPVSQLYEVAHAVKDVEPLHYKLSTTTKMIICICMWPIALRFEKKIIAIY